MASSPCDQNNVSKELIIETNTFTPSNTYQGSPIDKSKKISVTYKKPHAARFKSVVKADVKKPLEKKSSPSILLAKDLKNCNEDKQIIKGLKKYKFESPVSMEDNKVIIRKNDDQGNNSSGASKKDVISDKNEVTMSRISKGVKSKIGSFKIKTPSQIKKIQIKPSRHTLHTLTMDSAEKQKINRENFIYQTPIKSNKMRRSISRIPQYVKHTIEKQQNIYSTPVKDDTTNYPIVESANSTTSLSKSVKENYKEFKAAYYKRMLCVNSFGMSPTPLTPIELDMQNDLNILYRSSNAVNPRRSLFKELQECDKD